MSMLVQEKELAGVEMATLKADAKPVNVICISREAFTDALRAEMLNVSFTPSSLYVSSAQVIVVLAPPA